MSARAEARPPARAVRNARVGHAAQPPVQEMRHRRRLCHGLVPPPWRPVHLRHARPHGPAVLAALPAGGRAGKLRVGRRRSTCGDALHRVPSCKARDRDAAGYRGRHGRLPAELRRVEARAGRAPVTVPEPAGQWLLGHRRRHGHEHASAQHLGGDRRGCRNDRRAGHRRRATEPARQGPGLSDGSDHRRSERYPGRVPFGSRPHRDACAGPHRGASRWTLGDHHHGAALRREEGRRRGCHQEDRRSRPGQGADRDRGSGRSLRPDRHADPGRIEARRRTAGCAEQALQAHGPPVDIWLQRSRARRRCPAHALPPRADHPLPRLSARSRHAQVEVRAAESRGAGAHSAGLPHRARQSRRGDRPHPGIGRLG